LGEHLLNGAQAQFDAETPETVHGVQGVLISAICGHPNKNPVRREQQGTGPIIFSSVVTEFLATHFFSGCSQTLTAQSFTQFTPSEFARLFVAFFQLKPFKKAIILDLLFENAHRFLKVIVDNPDLNFLQFRSPPFVQSIIAAVERKATRSPSTITCAFDMI
jgi:hypothetical protein